MIPALILTTALNSNAESLYRKPETTPNSVVQTTTNRSAHPSSTAKAYASGNLDNEILVRNPKFHAEGTQSLVPATSRGITLKNLRIGDVVNATIIESVIAFPDRPTPVRAIIRSGPLKGALFMGEASLERNTKRILINFKKFRLGNSADAYDAPAVALDEKGVLGLEGQYESDEWRYFAASFLSAGAAAYADATIERDQNAFGNYVENPNADTISKKALAGSMSKSADRFNEKAKAAPEYSVLEGPAEIQILVTDQPKRNE